jgi:hypothetical protein
MTTVTDRGNTDSSSSITNYKVGGSDFTPAEDDIILVFMLDNELQSSTTITGWGATWEDIGQVSPGADKCKIFAARIGASPSSDRPDVTYGTASPFSAVCFQMSGIDTSGTAADKFIQVASFNVYNPTSPYSLPSLSAFAKASNLSLNTTSIRTNNVFSAQTSPAFTQAVQSAGSVGRTTAAFYYDAEEVDQVVTGTNFGGRRILGFACELDVASGGGPTGGFTNSLSLMGAG